MVYAEIYDREPAPPRPCRSRGQDCAACPARRYSRRPTSGETQDADGGVHRYTVQVPLDDDPPGDYVLTVDAVARAGGRTVQRRLPLTIAR